MPRPSLAVGVAAFLLVAGAVGGALLLGGRKPSPPSTATSAAREGPSGLESPESPARAPAEPEALAPGIPGVRREVEAPASEAEAAPSTTGAGVAGFALEATSGSPVRRFTLRGRDAVAARRGYGWGQVVIPARTIVTADGSFEVLDVRPGRLDLEFEAEGFVPEVVEDLEVTEGQVLRGVEARLRRGVRVRGTVVERGTSAPVVSATIYVLADRGSSPGDSWPRFEPPRAWTGPGGEFEFAGLEPGAIRLAAVHDSFSPASSGPFEAKDGEVVDGVLIPLSRGGALDGYALREGEPAPPGTRIRTSLFGSPLEAWSPPRDSAIDESGYFKVEGLPPGRYSVAATVPPGPDERLDGASWRRRSRHAVAVVEEGRTTRVVFPDRPEGPCTLRGRVLRGEEGVEGAEVLVVPTQPPGNFDPFRSPLSARTAAGGSFKVEHVPPGPATLRVQASPRGGPHGFAPRSLSIEIPDRPDHEIDVQLSEATISGRVVRAADGAPVAGFFVEAIPATLHQTQDLVAAPVARALTDEEGRYRVSYLEPGRYVVRAGRRWGRGEAEDEQTLASEARGPIEVAEGGETVVDFALARGGTAIVRVSDPGGRPVKEAGVLLVPAVVPAGLHLPYAGGMGRTNEHGIARVVGLRPGRYYATIPEAEFAGAESEEAEVGRDAETSFRIDLRRGTRVKVRVLDEGGAPADAIPVWTDSSGRERFTLPSGLGTGVSLRIEKGVGSVILLPGQYTVRVGRPPWKEQTTTVYVGTDSPQDVVLRLEREENP